MKKNGFTLAEVLITLAIIGVVATMTLPGLMTNTAEQQYVTGLKKGINVLTEAAQMSQAIEGYDFASLTTDAKDEEAQSLYGLLARRTTVDFGKSGAGKQESTNTGMAANYTVFFRDGSSLSFTSTDTSATGDYGTPQDDNLPQGIPAVLDTNGTKGPNMISNCSAAQTGLLTGEDSTEDAATACTKANRVIKDQFGVRLRAGFAVPNGAAARWAFAK